MVPARRGTGGENPRGENVSIAGQKDPNKVKNQNGNKNRSNKDKINYCKSKNKNKNKNLFPGLQPTVLRDA